MKFTAVITAHDQEIQPIIKDLLNQTRRPDEVLVYWSGESTMSFKKLFWEREVVAADPPDDKLLTIQLHSQPNLNDWGHNKRDTGLRAASGDFIGFFNADDHYPKTYIETMMREAEKPGTGFVYCWWHPMGRCTPALGSSTSGNFIVRQDLAKVAGYWKDRHYEADGTFIDAVVKAAEKRGSSVIEVPEILYYHNVR